MIRYLDTRGAIDRPRTFTEAILEGIAPGGGLFVPERLPSFSVDEVLALAAMPYHARAAAVYEAFGLDVSAARTREIAAEAYGANFDDARGRPGARGGPGPSRARALARPHARLQGHGPAVHAAVLQRGAGAGAREGRHRPGLPHPGGDQRRHGRGGAQRLRRPRPHQHLRVLPGRRRLGPAGAADGHAAGRQPHRVPPAAATSTTARPPSRPSSTTAPSRPSWPSVISSRSARPTPSTGDDCCRRSSTT